MWNHSLVIAKAVKRSSRVYKMFFLLLFFFFSFISSSILAAFQAFPAMSISIFYGFRIVSAQQTEADLVNIDSHTFYSNLVLLCWQPLSSSHQLSLAYSFFFTFVLSPYIYFILYILYITFLLYMYIRGGLCICYLGLQ